ncbi:DNA replication terminus site-binding protein [Aquipseudomonas alcaligenes]|nr:DNA replication terminus site-binding protein [Pseudomonas alcaligenes]
MGKGQFPELDFGFADEFNGAILPGDLKSPAGKSLSGRYVAFTTTDLRALRMESTSTVTDAIEAAGRLVEALTTLREGMLARRDEIRVDAAFNIGMRDTDEVDPDAEIDVSSIEGDVAVDLVVEALTSVHLRPNQKPRTTLRVPGAVGMPNDLLAQVRHCNDLRNQLYLKVHGIQPVRARQAVWKRTGITSALQALRQTVLLDRPQRISFFWNVGTSFARYKLSDLRQELLELLHHYSAGKYPVPPKVTQPFDLEGLLKGSVELRLKTQLNILLGLPEPEEQVVLLRPVRPHVRARITYQDRGNGDQPQASKPMSTVPFVYDKDHGAPLIVALSKYDPKAASPPRSKYKNAQLEPAPWNKDMNLYRYRDHRTDPVEISSKQSRVKRLQNLEEEGTLN